MHRRRPGPGRDLRERGGLTPAPGCDPGARARVADEATLREVIEALAPLERRAGSEGERRAAEWIAQRLQAAGCPAAGRRRAVPRRLRARDGHAVDHQRPGRSGGAGQPPRPPVAGAVAGAVSAAIADDVSNGPRLFRRAAEPAAHDLERRRATCGDRRCASHAGAARPPRRRPHRQDLRRQAPAVAGRDDSPASSSASTPRCRSGGRCWPRPRSSPLGSLRGRRGLIAAGAWPARRSGAAVFEDVARSPVVPGANDNLTAVAVLVALAERLRATPVARPPRAAGLLRRRGGPPGRDLRLRAPPLPRARPRADVVPQPGDARLAAADPARGRGAGGDGGLPSTAPSETSSRGSPTGPARRCGAGCARATRPTP